MEKRTRRQLATALALVSLTTGCAQSPQPAESEQPESQEEPIKLTIGGYYQDSFVVGD